MAATTTPVRNVSADQARRELYGEGYDGEVCGHCVRYHRRIAALGVSTVDGQREITRSLNHDARVHGVEM